MQFRALNYRFKVKNQFLLFYFKLYEADNDLVFNFALVACWSNTEWCVFIELIQRCMQNF